MSSLRTPRGVRPERLRTEQIEMRRLDAIIDDIVLDIPQPRLFLKMDTQGFDLEVFWGAQRTLDMIQGLQSELSAIPIYDEMPHSLETFDVYEKAGFCLYDLTVVSRNDASALLEMNCFMHLVPAGA